MTFWKKPKFILWSLLVLLVTIIVFQNVEPVQVDFLFWSILSMPKLVLILISMAVGAVLTLMAYWDFRSRRQEKKDHYSDHPQPPTLH